MRLTNQVEEAQRLLEESIERMDDQDAKIQALPDDTHDEVRDLERAIFDKLKDEARTSRERVERLIAIQHARETIPVREETKDEEGNSRPPVKVTEPLTYRADNNDKVSFFKDMHFMNKGDGAALERLHRHQLETRDVSTADPGAGVFLPPAYLGELWAELPREGRPFADMVPKMPLPDAGISITVPRVTTGTATGIQASEAAAVTETDIDGTLLTVGVNTIAGQNDVSLRALERTMPGMDFLIFQDLRADYDEQLDTQLLAGTGASQQHLGIRAVSGINTVTWTDGTPTAAELVPKIYDGIQKIATARFRKADTIVLHPRRAAWLASNLSSTFPLFQLGVLTQAAGSQAAGFVDNFAGLATCIDGNVSTEFGVSTDEDEIYVVRTADLILMEEPLRVRVFDDVLSGTLQVRLQVVAYSAFISGRQPGAITKISGTGLKGATF